jgi:NADH dehydrogenase
MPKKKIVIAGAGFSGAAALGYLKKIQKKNNCEITLVDERDFFLFTPLLHEVATGSLTPKSIIEPTHNLAGPRVRVFHNRVEHFHFKDKRLQVNDGYIDYDILVLGLGSQTHFFETPGAKEHAFQLKNMKHALAINHRVLDIFKAASQARSPEQRKEMLQFSIVGAGPTGVELACELAEWTLELADYYALPREDITISLYNGGKRVLRTFSQKTSDYAEKVLVKRGVRVTHKIKITEVRENAVVAGETSYPSNMTIWTAGVRPVSGECTPEPDLDAGFVCAQSDLRSHTFKDVFVLGDMARVAGNSYPMTAQVARQEGLWAAKNIERILQGKKTQPFEYKHRGDLISLGQGQAVAHVFGMHFRGPLAWFMWRTVYLFNFHSWKKRTHIMLEWTRELFRGRRARKASL